MGPCSLHQPSKGARGGNKTKICTSWGGTQHVPTCRTASGSSVVFLRFSPGYHVNNDNNNHNNNHIDVHWSPIFLFVVLITLMYSSIPGPRTTASSHMLSAMALRKVSWSAIAQNRY